MVNLDKKVSALAQSCSTVQKRGCLRVQLAGCLSNENDSAYTFRRQAHGFRLGFRDRQSERRGTLE